MHEWSFSLMLKLFFAITLLCTKNLSVPFIGSPGTWPLELPGDCSGANLVALCYFLAYSRKKKMHEKCCLLRRLENCWLLMMEEREQPTLTCGIKGVCVPETTAPSLSFLLFCLHSRSPLVPPLCRYYVKVGLDGVCSTVVAFTY